MNKIQMTGSVEIQAAGQETTDVRRFAVTAYTGGLLRVKPYPLPVVIDLAGLQEDSVIVANLDHDPTQRVGHIDGVTNDGKQLVLHGPVSATGDSAAEFLSSANNKYPWRASIEAAPTVEMQHIAAGKQVTVNGQTLTGPFLLASKSVLTGVAFLSRPADSQTRVSLAATEAAPLLEIDMSFETWLTELGVDPANVSEEQMTKLKAVYEQENKEEPVEPVVTETVDATFDASEIRASASDHLSNLEAIYAGYEDVKPEKFAEIRATASTNFKQLKAKALKEKWTTPKFEAECILASAHTERDLVRAERPAGPAIHASRVDTNDKVIEAALCQTLGMPNIEAQYDEKTLDAAHTAFKGRIGIQQMLIMAAQSNGYRCQPGERLGNGNLREVLRYAFQPIHAATSSLSLPGILSNIANKELLMGFEDVDQSWREVSAVKSVNDFKQNTSYRLLDNMAYEELASSAR